MDKRSAVMLALYLVVIAMGVEMVDRQPVLGTLQVIVGAALFGFRLYWSINRNQRRDGLSR